MKRIAIAAAIFTATFVLLWSTIDRDPVMHRGPVHNTVCTIQPDNEDYVCN